MTAEPRPAPEPAHPSQSAVMHWQQRFPEDIRKERTLAASREQRVAVKRRSDAFERAEVARATRTASLGATIPDASPFTGPQAVRAHQPSPRPDRWREREAPTIVLAHRHSWIRDQLARALEQHGFLVLAALDDGADAVGICIAEQPDLLLIEARLPSFTSREILAAVQQFAPHTSLAIHGADTDSFSTLRTAGAAAVFHRGSHPACVSAELLALTVDAPSKVHASHA